MEDLRVKTFYRVGRSQLDSLKLAAKLGTGGTAVKLGTEFQGVKALLWVLLCWEWAQCLLTQAFKLRLLSELPRALGS